MNGERETCSLGEIIWKLMLVKHSNCDVMSEVERNGVK